MTLKVGFVLINEKLCMMSILIAAYTIEEAIEKGFKINLQYQTDRLLDFKINKNYGK